MKWRLSHSCRVLFAAGIGLVVACVFDAGAVVNVTKYCPNHAYVDGAYTCLNFATDFQTNCQAAGQQSWIATIVVAPNDPTCAGVIGHAMNVVTAPSCDLTSDLQRYCLVEPQNGNNWCWTQNSGSPSIPSWVMQAATTGMGAFAACIVKGSYVYTLTGQ